MKKMLYTIGLLMFLSAPLHPWLGLAADEESPQDQSCNVLKDPACMVTDRLEYALREKGNKGLDWGKSFGATTPDEVGQNLYLMIYNKTQTNPMGEAIKQTAAQYGIPPERMSLILGGDITPILEKSPMMRIDDAVNIYNGMIATYNDKKNTQDVQATINAKIEPAEMFADGDPDNSGGFDLIKDLDNIEVILFQKNDLVTFGGQYNAEEDTPAGGENPPASGETNIPVDTSGPAGGGSSSGQTPGAGGSGAGGAGTAKPAPNPFAAEIEDKSNLFAGGINPNQCFANQNIDQALEKFSQDSATNPKLQSTFVEKSSGQAGSGQTGSGTGSGAAGAGGTGSGNGTGDVNIPVDSTPAAPPLTPATPGDYSAPPLCDDIVCISLDFVKKPATASFQKTDNCIQCHVQFINEGLQKTIGHSLIPAKATGNLGESALCKNSAADALRSVGMNVSISIVPMITPTKEEMINMGNIADEWDKYAQVNGLWNYSEIKRRQLEAKEGTNKGNKTPIMSTAQRMLEVVINNAPDGATQAEIMNKTSQALTAEQSAETQEMLVAEIAKDAYAEVDSMKALEDEMKAMNDFFENFQKQIRTLIEDVPGLVSSKACEKLDTKKACT